MDKNQWLKQRQRGIGGSDISAVLGVNPWKTSYDLWLEKTGRAPLETATTPAMQRGTILEPVVADLYAEETGRRLRKSNQILKHPDHVEIDDVSNSPDSLENVNSTTATYGDAGTALAPVLECSRGEKCLLNDFPVAGAVYSGNAVHLYLP